jgi:mannose-6-phosphate isomerase-like protein (cupin superfamily)
MSVKHDSDVANVLCDDGVDKVVIGEMENATTTNFDELISDMGTGSWAVRLVYNDRFGGVLIQQQPGEGNRMHYHPDADECWVIVSGLWEWNIEGKGVNVVSKNDMIIVEKGVKHKITCIGTEPGTRFAITAPDVNHVYDE